MVDGAVDERLRQFDALSGGPRLVDEVIKNLHLLDIGGGQVQRAVQETNGNFASLTAVFPQRATHSYSATLGHGGNIVGDDGNTVVVGNLHDRFRTGRNRAVLGEVEDVDATGC